MLIFTYTLSYILQRWFHFTESDSMVSIVKPLTHGDFSALGFLCEESSQVLSGVWRLLFWKPNEVRTEM